MEFPKGGLLPLCAGVFLLIGGCKTPPPPPPGPVNAVEGETVRLDLPDARPGIAYQWVQLEGEGPQVEIRGATSAEASFVAPEATTSYALTFARVRRGDGETETLQILVRADNDAPTAEAGDPREVDEGERVTLFGNGSDPERQNVSYRWLQVEGPPVELDDPQSASPSFSAPNVTELSYLVFELRVSDGTKSSQPDEARVAVRPVNSLPVADAGADFTVREGERGELSGAARDDDGQPLRYRWRVVTDDPLVRLDDPNAEKPVFVAPECPADVESYALVFELTVHDGIEESRPDRVQVTVAAINSPPVALAGEDFEAVEGEIVWLSGGGSDEEGSELEYAWEQRSGTVEVDLLDPDSAKPSFRAPTVPGGAEAVEATFALTVSDGANVSPPDLVTVSIVPRVRPRILRALAPGEIDPLLGADLATFLDRWNDAMLAREGAAQGFVGDPLRTRLMASFRQGGKELVCDLPPGTWQLQGSLQLQDVETDGAGPFGGALRFQTGVDQTVSLELVSVHGKIGVRVHELERDERTGDWLPVDESLQILQAWNAEQPLYFAVTWREGMLGFQWSRSEPSVKDRPERRIELHSAPVRLDLQVERAIVVVEDPRLVGI